MRYDIPWEPYRKRRRDKGYTNPKEDANEVEVLRDRDADTHEYEGSSCHDSNDKGSNFCRDGLGTHGGRIREGAT